MGTRASKFQSSEELSGKTQVKKTSVSFHQYFQVFHILVQNLSSTFGVVRNDFSREDISESQRSFQ